MTMSVELHPLERKVLPILTLKEQDLSDICKKTNLSEVEVVRAIQWLGNKGFAIMEKTEEELVLLGKNGEKALEEGFPEKILFDQINGEKNNDGFVPISKIKLDKQEINISIGLLKKQGIVEIAKGKELEIKAIKKFPKTLDYQEFLKKIPCKKEKLDEEILKELLRRKDILRIDTKKIITAKASKKGSLVKISGEDSLESLSPQLLKTGKWKNKKFRSYDVEINVPKITGGRKHPMTAVMDIIRNVFVEMGFQEMKGPQVETAFWCMDSMWIPQDHPARDEQDTFYLPYKGTLPESPLVHAVRRVQEYGGDTGSKGYGVSWDSEKAKELLLRTHTTATTFRYLYDKKIKNEKNAKYFYIGRVFRNEAIDATHLPEFHQVEGFVMQEGLTLKHLMGFIKEFYAKLGINEIKFKVAYNPYTEPSLEALYYNKKRKKWMELINSGIFRPESLAPFGINKPIIAWGLGFERLAMTLYELDKLRDLVGPTCDLEWLKNYKIPIRKEEGEE